MSKEKNYIFNEQAYLIWKLADRAFASLRTGGLINNDKGKLPLSLITGRYSPKSLKCRAERRPLRRGNLDSLCGAVALST